MRKVKLVYNSVAGQSKFKYFLDTVIEKFVSAGYEVSLFRGSKTANLDEYIKNIDKDAYAIVVAGGDGTLNRVLNAMMKNNINIPLGIIPAGTSNDFARHLKTPKNFNKAIDRILEGNIQDIDVGKVNDKYFINVCSAGLFTSASQKVDVVIKNLIGKVSYFITAISQLISFKPFFVKIETKDDIIIEKVSLFLVFNGSSVGGLDTFTNQSSIQDGLLDVVIFKSMGITKMLSLLVKVLSGKHFDDEKVIYLKEPYLKITKAKGECDDPDIDGDKGPEFPMEIECVKNGLKLFM